MQSVSLLYGRGMDISMSSRDDVVSKTWAHGDSVANSGPCCVNRQIPAHMHIHTYSVPACSMYSVRAKQNPGSSARS